MAAVLKFENMNVYDILPYFLWEIGYDILHAFVFINLEFMVLMFSVAIIYFENGKDSTNSTRMNMAQKMADEIWWWEVPKVEGCLLMYQYCLFLGFFKTYSNA